jgi:multicomponent Na+:H+ antiporter subunit C
MDAVTGYIVGRGPYLLFVVLVVLGVYLMTSHRNYLKAMVGLYLFQSSVILFFVALGFRSDGTIPILPAPEGQTLDNPLPHAMMLTAIVVGVATLGLAISILRRIQAETGSIEERPSAEERANEERRSMSEAVR